MSRIYYRSAKAALVCFGKQINFQTDFVDLTDPKSFDKVKTWVEELTMNEEGCDIYVIGTKGSILIFPVT
jgi:Ras-related protein Rab-24